MGLTKATCRRFIEEQLFDLRPRSEVASPTAPPCSVGIELEAFPYRIDPATGQVSGVSFMGSDASLAPALLRAAAASGGEARFLPGGHLDTITFSQGDRFSFEPGGQVEIATAPCGGLDEVATRLARMQRVLAQVTDEDGIRFAQVGVQPWLDGDEIGLQVRTPRYLAMNDYFDAIGPFGRQMMRQTCSVQVNLELGCEPAAFTRRFVAANLISPFATAIFANSSMVAGARQEQRSYRSHLWRHLDPLRTGILPMERITRTFAMDDLVDAYLEFALNAPVLSLGEDSLEVLPPHLTLVHWLDQPIHGIEPTTDHLARHLSMLFPEVRPRGHVEIRSVDALPWKWQLVPAVFYSGLLLPEGHLEKTLECLLPLAPRIHELLEQAAWGLESPDLSTTARDLMGIALEGFSALPAAFRGAGHLETLAAFHEVFTARGKTLADTDINTEEFP